ncbi:MAG: MerR family transcriptional regulator [Vicinamibacterales bacterium]|nr:MerR family transcriptional regulator [Vicinamibacterales bacterium]
MPTKLKKSYSAREVAALTGLTARQLQWWDARRLLSASVASRPTAAGGFTERRYSPVELYELSALAELRRHGFTVQRIRKILAALREHFGIRLFEALGDGGPVTLLVDGQDIYARTDEGAFYNLLEAPGQPLLVLGEDSFKTLRARVGVSRRKVAKRKRSPTSER